jgi:hypothetical protein
MAEDFSEKNKDYGLPKVEPHPIDRDQPGIAKEVVITVPRKEKKNNKLIVIVLSVVGLLILASLMYIIFGNNESSESSPRPTVGKVEDRAVLDQEDGDNSDIGAANESEENLDNRENVSISTEEPGSITTISQRTNRYYIFLGSYKFKAYAMRHAEKLAADGFVVKLITPDNWVGVRVAVGNYAKKEEASVDAQQIRSKYGNEVVISKY